VKLDCSKVLETCMKSNALSILTHLIFYTRLMQIQTPKFLLKKQYLSALFCNLFFKDSGFGMFLMSPLFCQ